MPDVRFTPQAIADLEEIKRYISDDLFNPQTAVDIVALVFKKIRELGSLPQTGARLRTDISTLKAYRFIQAKNYLVFYRTEAKHVFVIRVLYARRDYLELLEPDQKADDDSKPAHPSNEIPPERGKVRRKQKGDGFLGLPHG